MSDFNILREIEITVMFSVIINHYKNITINIILNIV